MKINDEQKLNLTLICLICSTPVNDPLKLPKSVNGATRSLTIDSYQVL